MLGEKRLQFNFFRCQWLFCELKCNERNGKFDFVSPCPQIEINQILPTNKSIHLEVTGNGLSSI